MLIDYQACLELRMTRTGCGKGKRRHTPIVSESQRGLFGAEYQRRKEGKHPMLPSITTEELRSHLKESKGKNLPKRKK